MKSNRAMIETMMISIGFLLKPIAKAHVKSAHDKKQDDRSNEEEVAHCFRPDGWFSQKRE